MSFAFSTRRQSKAEVKEAISAELDKVVEAQPVHSKDRELAQTTANAIVDSLGDKEGHDIHVNVHGSLATIDNEITSATVGVSASLIASGI